MTNLQPDISVFTVPITEANHQVAQRFYVHHSDHERSKQVYLNTLSIQAVCFYITCIGFKPDLNQGLSWDPTLQALMNVADVWVDDVGRLECCQVLPGMDAVPVSTQATADRIGYLAVQLNADLTEAELLGFVPSLQDEWIDMEQVPLTEWRSLNELPKHLATLQSASSMKNETEVKPPSTTQGPWSESTGAIACLSGWLNNPINKGWQALDTIMEQVQQKHQANGLAYGFRQPLSSPHSHLISSDSVKRGKFLTLGEQARDELLFIVGVNPSPVGSELNITVEVYPFETQLYLPQTIQLAVMDETGKAVLQAQGGNSEGLEFHFSGEPGERFSVKVSVEGHQIIEQFQI